MKSFRWGYLAIAVALFVIEVLIALFVHDAIIRPYCGDLLVVILIYCFLRFFRIISIKTAAIATLSLAFFIEFLQYLNTVDRLGLQQNRLVRTVIGTSFSLEDLLMYVAGIMVVLVFEKFLLRHQ